MARFQSVEDVWPSAGSTAASTGSAHWFSRAKRWHFIASFSVMMISSASRSQIGGRERMMIREDMRGETQPNVADARRIATDCRCRHGMEAPAVEFRRGCGMAGIEQVVEVAAFEGHVETRPDAHTENRPAR